MKKNDKILVQQLKTDTPTIKLVSSHSEDKSKAEYQCPPICPPTSTCFPCPPHQRS